MFETRLKRNATIGIDVLAVLSVSMTSKPVVCMKLGTIPLPICQICLNQIEEGESMFFYGNEANSTIKRWVHWQCWRQQKREAEEHDRTEIPAKESVAADQEGIGRGAELVEELRELTAQLYDIEAHVGSALASARILQAKVKGG